MRLIQYSLLLRVFSSFESIDWKWKLINQRNLRWISCLTWTYLWNEIFIRTDQWSCSIDVEYWLKWKNVVRRISSWNYLFFIWLMKKHNWIEMKMLIEVEWDWFVHCYLSWSFGRISLMRKKIWKKRNSFEQIFIQIQSILIEEHFSNRLLMRIVHLWLIHLIKCECFHCDHWKNEMKLLWRLILFWSNERWTRSSGNVNMKVIEILPWDIIINSFTFSMIFNETKLKDIWWNVEDDNWTRLK